MWRISASLHFSLEFVNKSQVTLFRISWTDLIETDQKIFIWRNQSKKKLSPKISDLKILTFILHTKQEILWKHPYITVAYDEKVDSLRVCTLYTSWGYTRYTRQSLVYLLGDKKKVESQWDVFIILIKSALSTQG